MPLSLKPFANLLRRGGSSLPEDHLYDAIMAQARLPIYYQRLGVPDTLEGRFFVLTIHLFAVFRRLKDAGTEAAAIAQDLSDHFVADMDTVLREIGVGDLSVPKKVRKLVASGATLIESYDRAADASENALETEIAANLPLDEETAEIVSKRLTPYVRAMLQALEDQPIEAIGAGRLQFPEIPTE
jgi:cytochrome b pre-mRNA-processing protein 3